MANERLRAAIVAAGLTVDRLAADVGVDPKTVERWIAADSRRPHRTTRRQVAHRLNIDEVHLWPSVATNLQTEPPTDSEVLQVFPSRSAIPYSLWTELIKGVQHRMDVLVYSGQFLVEQHNMIPIIRDKVKDGVQYRLAVGDETSSAVIQRAIEEGTTGGLEGRVQMMRRYLSEVAHLSGVEIRTHGTVLYNSIYRFDNQALINGHAFGGLAGQNPVLYIRRIPGGMMWEHFMKSFDKVWDVGMPEVGHGKN